MPIVVLGGRDANGAEFWATDGSSSDSTQLANTYPFNLTTINGLAYFDANGSLWRSDGTVAGTYAFGQLPSTSIIGPIADVAGQIFFVEKNGANTGLAVGLAGGGSRYLATTNVVGLFSVDNRLVAETETSAGQYQLWTSDGTVAGTVLITNLAHPNAHIWAVSSPTELFFLYDDGSNGEGCLATDGTVAGTTSTSAVTPLGTIGPAINGNYIFGTTVNNVGEMESWNGAGAPVVLATSAAGFWSPLVYGNLAFFLENNNLNSYLYVTDGTVAGTAQLGQGQLTFAALADGEYYLAGQTIAGGYGLYRSSGTPSSMTMVFSGAVGHVVTVNGDLIFSGPNGSYLSDGTPAGTLRFTPDPILNSGEIVAGRHAFILTQSSAGPLTELWASDGTLAGTTLITTFAGINTVTQLTAIGAQIEFSVQGSTGDSNLWVSDGTVAGTHIVNLVADGPGDLTVAGAMQFDGKFVFTGSISNSGDRLTSTVEPWVSDGTAAGTGPLVTESQFASQPSDFAILGNQLFFSAYSAAGWQLFVSSGVPGDAQPIFGNFTEQGDRYFTVFDGRLFFYDGVYSSPGTIWSTDGTADGTVRVDSDIYVEHAPAVLNGELLFTGNDQTSGYGLYSSDGTAAGTHFVASLGGGVATLGYVVSGSKMFFVSVLSSSDGQLWVTDGTTAGTQALAGFASGSDDVQPTNLTAFDSGVVVNADDGVHGQEVWFSDGTVANTFLIGDINTTLVSGTGLELTEPSNYYGLQPTGFSVGGKAVFEASGGGAGDELWVTDGTAAGMMVLGNFPAGAGLNPKYMTMVGGKLYFVDSNGTPWLSDGTVAGTVEISSGLTGAGPPVLVDGKLYFSATAVFNGLFHDGGVYVTDGTVAGTSELAVSTTRQVVGAGNVVYYQGQVNNGPFHWLAYNVVSGVTTDLTAFPIPLANSDAYGFAQPLDVTLNGDMLYRSADSANGAALWISDGTVAGTHILIDFVGFSGPISDSITAGNGGYFMAAGASGAWGLFFTDGTTAGTKQISLSAPSTILNVANLSWNGGHLYFTEEVNGGAQQLWDYKAATNSLSMVKTLYFGADYWFPTLAGSLLYFETADTSTGQAELWSLSAGGVPVQLTTASSGMGASFMTPSGSNLFFIADDSAHGQSLFVTNGTKAGTLFLTSAVAANPVLEVINGELYFEGTDATHGDQLWESNGTVAGTKRVSFIAETAGSNAQDFTVVGSTIYFSATDGVHGQELWSFSGTASSTKLVDDINPGSGSSNPIDLTAFNGALYLIAVDSAGHAEVWRSGGTAATTTSVTTASNGAGSADLTIVGDKLFFFGSDSQHGAGLFVSDGTASGTEFLRAFSSVDSIVADGSEAIFHATDSVTGSDLWESNGTAVGTVQYSHTGLPPPSEPAEILSLGAATGANTSDFGGFGASNLLWRNDNGTLDAWVSKPGASYSFADGNQGIIDPNWQVAQVGDFNGDGKSDILWRNSVTGNTNIWLSNSGSGLNGFVGQGEGLIATSWAIQGVGDFNGDGKADVLWRNTDGTVDIWNSNAGTGYTGFTGQGFGQIGTDWSIAGVGDFNGDGRSDVLWRNANGDVNIWMSNSATGPVAMTGDNLGVIPTNWVVAGVGDFNGDGKADILWRDTNTGDVDVWLSNSGSGFNGLTGTDLGVIPTSWTIEQVGDFNGDGKADIVWRNSNGDVDIWMSNTGSGFTGLTGQFVGNVGSDWHIV